ncbi:MAG: putative lipid II flippase FtsW [Verrucomicrobiota bacterium]
MKAAITLLVFCVGALLSLGMVMLYSAGMTRGGAQFFLAQLAWCGLGLIACLSAAWFDYRWLKKLAIPMLIVSVILLGLVLIPGIGFETKGARRWFRLGIGSFQPSEAAKLALICALAWYGARYQRHMHTFTKGLVIPGVFILLVLGLIFVEPDRGTTILLAAVSGTMLLLAGVRWLYIIPPVALGSFAISLSLWFDDVRRSRILSWLDPEAHKLDTGYQSWQAMVALGSGGWQGLGLGNGRQKMGFLPEHHTDFIFSIIGEELGLIATLGVILLFVIFIICGLYIAWRAPDTFGMLLGSGITFLIGLQAFINIGVVTSALPNKGLPLPFISYGGSNLLMMLISVGILLSIARHSESWSELTQPAGRDELPDPQPA